MGVLMNFERAYQEGYDLVDREVSRREPASVSEVNEIIRHFRNAMQEPIEPPSRSLGRRAGIIDGLKVLCSDWGG